MTQKVYVMCVVICIDSRSTSIPLQVCGSCSCFLRRTTVLHFSFLALSLLPSPPPSSPGRFCVAGRVGGFSAEEPFQRLPEVGAACSARQWHHHCTLWTKDLTAGWCGEEITCTSINLQEVYSVYSNAIASACWHCLLYPIFLYNIRSQLQGFG